MCHRSGAEFVGKTHRFGLARIIHQLAKSTQSDNLVIEMRPLTTRSESDHVAQSIEVGCPNTIHMGRMEGTGRTPSS